jgi:hypothetical protein
MAKVRQAADEFVAEAVSFGVRFIRDDKVRQGYVAEAKDMATKLIAKVDVGVLTPEQAV